MKNLQHFTDGTAAAHQFSVVQYGGLAGGGSTLRLVKAQRHAVVFRGFTVQDAAAARLRTFTP